LINIKNKSTGQLAWLTIFLAWAGNAARLFTTANDVGDFKLLAMYLLAFTTQLILLAQFVIYRKPVEVREHHD